MGPTPASWSLSETKTRRIRLVVAYDGTDFCGWAPQRGRRTVHGTLTDAVRRVSGEENEPVGASRTDAGAHARAQSCHFDTDVSMPMENWRRALNDALPGDVAVQSARIVHREFHARFWALNRWYRYRIHCAPRDPERGRYTYGWGRPLDTGAMAEAARRFEGQRDFRAFTQLLEAHENTVRTVSSVRVSQARDEVRIDIVALAFARGMMRRVCGALFEVGRGSRDPETIDRLFERPYDRDYSGHWPVVLPAGGLCLMKVDYGRKPSDQSGRFRNDND